MRAASRRIELMGTHIDTKIWHDEPEMILDQVENLLYLYKDRFSANDANSELMQINRHAGEAPVQVASDLFELIEMGKAHSVAEGSRLNITIGPLIQTWRIGFSDARVPSPAEIEEKLTLIDPNDIVLDAENQTVFLRKRGMAIDLGALAKGYIADRIMEHLARVGVQKGLINLGGNVLTMGEADHNADGLWRIGLQNPKLARGNNIAVLKLPACSIVTSGVYERTFTYEGKTYHHIFDSQTGYPVATNVASLTIVSEKSVDGEIWTTRLFGLEVEDIFHTVMKEPGIEAIVITDKEEMYYTPGLANAFL